MRSYITSLLALCVSIIALVIAVSQHSRAANETTRVEIDQQANVIRFIIDGEERALLDDGSLHVNGNIEFTGQTIDIGTWNNREAANAP